MPKSSRNAVRFGVFEVDLASAELRKHGVKLRLQEQPFQVLAALLDRPGEVVTREDLIHRLWADGTVVDYDRGLNAAVTRLRQALSDSADVPRYVETVARRGYRFIGSVEGIEAEQPAPTATPATSRPPKAWLVALLALLVMFAAGWRWLTRPQTSRPENLLKVIPLTTGSGIERNVSFSPDGTQVVYEWAQDDGKAPVNGKPPHLYIKVVASSDPIPLTWGAAAEYGPAWSPDGRLIAFLRQLDQARIGIFVKPPLGGVERKITEAASSSLSVRLQAHRRLDWTTDSKHLIVSAPEHAGGGEGLLLISVEGGNSGDTTWLTKPSDDPQFGDRDPAVSPDGRIVAFARGQVSASETIYLLPVSGDLRPSGAPRPLASVSNAQNLAWTPDGKQVVYSTLAAGMTLGSGLWSIRLDSGSLPRPLLTLDRNIATPAVARTGRLAYSRINMEGHVFKQEMSVRAGTVAPPVNLSASSSVDFNVQYSPDGSRIAFQSNRSGAREIWTCASDGDHCVQITHFNASFVTDSPRWSPDGTQIVFDSAAAGRSGVYVVKSDGGSPRRLTDDNTHGMYPSWSYDGRWIYFCSPASGRNEIWKIPSAGGKPVQVTKNGAHIPLESPDGKTLYYTDKEQDARLLRSTVDGAGETEVLSGVAHRGFVIAADRIYYMREEPDGSTGIRRFMLATGVDSPIVSVSGPVFVGLSLSPDGKYLVYSQLRVAMNLMLVEDFH
jgi:Tol biopolymer transport system component/DNA-binding winged helix-turn-helix (wHTH) protein